LSIRDNTVAVVLVAPAHLARLLEHDGTAGVFVLVVRGDVVALLEGRPVRLALVVDGLNLVGELERGHGSGGRSWRLLFSEGGRERRCGQQTSNGQSGQKRTRSRTVDHNSGAR